MRKSDFVTVSSFFNLKYVFFYLIPGEKNTVCCRGKRTFTKPKTLTSKIRYPGAWISDSVKSKLEEVIGHKVVPTLQFQ